MNNVPLLNCVEFVNNSVGVKVRTCNCITLITISILENLKLFNLSIGIQYTELE